MDDRRLLANSRKGQGGFDAFYRRYRDPVLAFHARRVNSPELAADLTAETFAAALAAIHESRAEIPRHPAAWLFTIAHRKLVDSYRKGRIEDEARRRIGMEPLTLDDEDLERIDDTALASDEATELAKRLPPDQYAALKARVLDQRDYEQIAAELECSPSVVRMRVSRALNTLRVTLEAKDE